MIVELKAGRELDALIAETVMGRTDVHDYSTNISRAWEVAERHRIGVLPDPFGSGWIAGTDEAAGWESSVSWAEAQLYGQPGPGDPWVVAETAPLAICLAALKAVGALEPKSQPKETGNDREQILSLIARADKLLDEHDCRMGDSRANEAQELLWQVLEPKPQP